jgi:hypothetical protein
MMTPGLHCRLSLFLALHACLAPAAGTAASNSKPPTGDYRSSPVFYERYRADIPWVGDELELLRQGRVRIEQYPPVDVTDFNWERDSFTEYTWWMEMQDLRFLLPAIASSSTEDRRMARAWFMRWYAEHMVPEPATTHWGEPMTVGFRAMVLVRLLKAEEQRVDPDAGVIQCLRSTILAHQRDLARPNSGDEGSNHGFISALGLFETTRVIPDSSAATIALTRIETMMGRIVSRAGVEKEQSPAYHFVVLNWLEQMAGYFGSLPGPPRVLASRMSGTIARMRRAGYFLQDHAGRLPPIGDTDSVAVDAYSSTYRVMKSEGDACTLFDVASGYAIYKGIAARPDCRYVVFRVPDEHFEMPRHCHADALSVFFSYAGETILGDSGRLTYSSSTAREFMVSARAHNTVVPYPIMAEQSSQPRPAYDVAELPDRPGSGWTASAHLYQTTCTRTVRVPEAPNAIQVLDSLQPLRPGSSGAADFVVLWHLGSDVTDVLAGSAEAAGEFVWSITTKKGQRIRLAVKAEGPGEAGIVEAGLVRGQTEPLLGWYSAAQDVLRPVSTIVIHVRRDPTVLVTTEVEVEKGACITPPTGSSTRGGQPAPVRNP